jgi:hypothetical protein
LLKLLSNIAIFYSRKIPFQLHNFPIYFNLSNSKTSSDRRLSSAKIHFRSTSPPTVVYLLSKSTFKHAK